jgi:hypothetical protein
MFFWESYVVKAVLDINNNQLVSSSNSSCSIADKENTPLSTKNSSFSSAGKENTPLSHKNGEQNTKTPIKLFSARRALVNKTNPPAKKKKATAKKPVYLCGTCMCDVVDNPKSDSERSV